MVRNYVSRKKTPTYDVNEVLLKKLCTIQCTYSELSACLGVSVDTLERRYAEKIKAWKEAGKSSLRHAQWQKAMEGHPGDTIMQKHLGKYYLDQIDGPTTTSQQTLFDKFDSEMSKTASTDTTE